MSYDLYFKSRGAAPAPPALQGYFADREHYRLGDAEAGYENDDTGVYFSFGWKESLWFNLNYFRPHTFGLEAEPEVRAFIEHFGFDIDDPQADGMGDGPYSREGFLRGWNAGNRFGHRAMLQTQGGMQTLAVPAAVNGALWRWNFAKSRCQETFEDTPELPPAYVPTAIPILDTKGQVRTCVFWTRDMPLVLPEVEWVCSADASGLLAVPVPQLLKHVQVHTEWSGTEAFDGRPLGMRAWVINEPTPAVRKAIDPCFKAVGEVGRISPDQLLDRELLSGN